MLRLVGGVAGVLLLVVAVLFEPVIKPVMRDMGKTPRDPVLGTIDEMTPAQLTTAYAGKRVLLVGGTRGVGRCTALAVAAAGAHVTVVGRSEASGTKVLKELRAAAPPGSAGSFTFLQGDLGSARSSAKLLNVLQEDAAANGKYDYFVQVITRLCLLLPPYILELNVMIHSLLCAR